MVTHDREMVDKMRKRVIQLEGGRLARDERRGGYAGEMTGRAKLLFAEAWRSLGANLSTTVAATMTVLIGMFLLGLFIALGTWTVSWSNHVKSELVVKVNFDTKHQPTRAQETAYARQLQSNPYVKAGGIKYVSKAEALKYMQKTFGELTTGLPYNPLPDRLELTPNKPENVDKLYNSVTGTQQVTDRSTTSATASSSRTGSSRSRT